MDTLPIIGSIGALFFTMVSGFLWLGLRLGRFGAALEGHQDWIKNTQEKVNGHIKDHATGRFNP
jgi:hypothetical protein|tara:strand:- start:533 stop:724 length:192 start_codon:yes stop_codon:yes gene_type:complete